MAFGWPASSLRACVTNSLATSAVFLLSRIGGDGIERRDAGDSAGRCRATWPCEAGAAEHDDEAVLLHRLDEDFDAGDLHLAQLDRRAARFLRWGCGRRGGR